MARLLLDLEAGLLDSCADGPLTSEQQFPLMNCESSVTVAADSSRSVSTTRFRLLKRLSQSAMAGGLVAGRLIS